MKPLISIVIPLYNKQRFIARAVESIQQQSFTEWELIIVNDGSTDSSLEVAQSLAGPRIRIFSQANQGPGAARNKGMDEARADLITFLDADDTLSPEFLATGYEALTARWPQSASWTCGYSIFPGNHSQEAFWRKRGIREGLQQVSHTQSPALFAHQLAFMHCTTLARRATLQRYGGFFARNRCVYGEDSFLWLHLLLQEQVVFAHEPLFQFHRDASELSGNFRQARPIEPFLVYPEEIREHCPEPLRPLLEQFLTLRAFKTACVLGYWGQWREAAQLRQRFRQPGDWGLPLALAAAVCSTPLGGWLGWLHRRWRA